MWFSGPQTCSFVFTRQVGSREESIFGQSSRQRELFCRMEVGSPRDSLFPLPRLKGPHDAVRYKVQGLRLSLLHRCETPQGSPNPSPTAANAFPVVLRAGNSGNQTQKPELEGASSLCKWEPETGSHEGGAGGAKDAPRFHESLSRVLSLASAPLPRLLCPSRRSAAAGVYGGLLLSTWAPWTPGLWDRAGTGGTRVND